MRRVVVTGMSGISPIGNDWENAKIRLQAYQNAITYMPDWEIFNGLNTKLAAPVNNFSLPAHYNRKILRSMSRVGQFSARVAELAAKDSGLLGDPVLKSGRAGVSFGSSSGGTEAIVDISMMSIHASTAAIKANTYIKMMPHTTGFNVGVFLGMTGRNLPSSTACTSGSLSIGMGYESIKFGLQDIMIVGGAEELSPAQASIFDTLFATSVRNKTPELTPKPFDKHRDGLVIGEGGGALILEELEHALSRDARIYAELVGFGTNSDGKHATQPEARTMGIVMQIALDCAGIDASEIGYVNAHGTGTDRGDVTETTAMRDVFKRSVPVSSLKSYMGHTLGACGALEAWLSIQMMNEKWFAPTLNLDEIDENCADLDYITQTRRDMDAEYIMTNNFAFGGINTSLIFKRWD